MNRKATFAKRQRETDLKDHARVKEARKMARRESSRAGKGPEIAWDEAVYPTTSSDDDAPAPTSPAPAAADAPPATDDDTP